MIDIVVIKRNVGFPPESGDWASPLSVNLDQSALQRKRAYSIVSSAQVCGTRGQCFRIVGPVATRINYGDAAAEALAE